MTMPTSQTISRKKEHIKLSLKEESLFNSKTSGFEYYEFEHNAASEVDFGKIDLSTKFFGHRINFPFLISCMTGGTSEAERINERLAICARELKIPIGVGSQRQALESKEYHSTYRVIRKNAGKVPVLGNIGAAQVAKSKRIVEQFKLMIDLVEADAMVIHLNPTQELIQKEGEPNFKGFYKNLEILLARINVPIIVKEVGAGISKPAAKRLLDAGVKGIDVAGAGGTSWAGIELQRNKQQDDFFHNWGLPTAYCVRTVAELKKSYKFQLIASGGITGGAEIAKSLALGADMAAAARPILIAIINSGVEGAIKTISEWFVTVKKIMYLTGIDKVKDFHKIKLLRRTEIF